MNCKGKQVTGEGGFFEGDVEETFKVTGHSKSMLLGLAACVTRNEEVEGNLRKNDTNLASKLDFSAKGVRKHWNSLQCLCGCV